ncbi:hypothetical protein [Fluviispira multicolorata]|uniref:Uncharacterized protein n=1 Tax=Fluviispira multicolorata TaxID=2654512 RepID=A0A833N4C3_9BACT|nr:hypothetical protein [Fluviispira multicolorata]KAB8030681.1 hypothetical protein GCL57_06820 [Fluviispira multicolorata]
MIKRFQDKKSIKKLFNFTFIFTATPLLLVNFKAFSSTSLMVSGHAGIVGQATYNTPPAQSDYAAFRVPIGMLLEARPTDNFSLYLGLEYAYNNYPGPSTLLGQNSESAANPTDKINAYSLLPFSNSLNISTPYSQNVDVPTLTQAYFTYQTAIGLISAGRMPRNWGLGIWRNAEWSPYGSLPTTTDAVALYTDFNAFDIAIYVEKYGKLSGGTSKDGDATAYTIEARLKSDPADVSSSGVSQELGISFSKFSHSNSNTSLNILDLYTKFYISKFFLGTEVLYPSGSTQSLNYQNLGGSSEAISTDLSKSSLSQKFEGVFAALLKMKYQIGGNDNSSIASVEKSQKLLGTNEREESHVIGFWGGYASGGSNQFDPNPAAGSNISAAVMNSNIQPSFLMFNNTMPAINGMPGGAITNSTFIRLDYTYENPSFGSVGPTVVWAALNQLNKNNFNDCTASSVSVNSSVNKMCVGFSRDLGVELDVSYRYTTLDRVTFGVDAGYWFVGQAWQATGQNAPSGNYGLRTSISTEF